MLKERTSAHERVRAIVVTGVTPEVGVTWRVARVYVLCWVESRVIPHCILGRESCMIPQTDVAPEVGMTCQLCCVLESRVIPCGTLGRVMCDSPDGRHTRVRVDVPSGVVSCESCVIPCGTLGRIMRDSPNGRHARGRGDVHVLCLVSHA